MHRQDTIIAVTLATMLLAGTACAQSRPATQEVRMSLPPSDKLPIAAWDGPAVTPEVVARYQEFADAGFTHNMTAFVNPEQAQIGLDAAAKAGVKVLTRYWPHSPTVLPPDMARQFKGHPGLGGYVLQDEPTISEFPELLARTKAVLAADPDPSKVVIVNLLPTYAGNAMIGLAPHQKYEDYVFKFLSEIPVTYLSYDHYPLKRFAPVPDWYENLLVARRAAAMADIPLWSFICCCGMDLFPDPTIGSLRIQGYTNLAMGAVGIEHFLYTACGGRVAPYNRAGERTYVYDLVKQFNAELQARAPVFLGSTSKLLRWAGPNMPEGFRAYEPKGVVKSLQVGPKGAIVSVFHKANDRFFVIVNQDFIEPMPLKATLSNSSPIGVVGHDGSVEMLDKPELDMQVLPGDALILMYQVSDKPEPARK